MLLLIFFLPKCLNYVSLFEDLVICSLTLPSCQWIIILVVLLGIFFSLHLLLQKLYFVVLGLLQLATNLFNNLVLKLSGVVFYR